MTESIRLVRTVAVKPDGAVRTHDHHAIHDDGNYQIPGKILENEQEEERHQSDEHQQTDKRYPVLLRLKDINSGKCLRPELLFTRNNKAVILVLPSVRGHVEKVVNKIAFNHMA
jgi:hypothetical protein